MAYGYYEKINGRKDLLITLGDSWTAGEGCYSDEDLADYNNGIITREQMNHRGYASQGPGSWPDTLSTLLNMDLINLGVSGYSNSACAKRLINEHDIDYKPQYDNVYVILLLSESSRISFYSNDKIKSFSMGSIDLDTKSMMFSYISTVRKSHNDSDRETMFFLKSLYYYCVAKGYKFFYGSAFSNITDINRLFNLPTQNFHTYIKPTSFCSMLLDISKSNKKDSKLFSKICGHPNKFGYEIIAKTMYDILTNKNQIDK